MIRAALITCGCLFVLVHLAQAKTDFHKCLPDDDPFGRVPDTHITPHIKWAKPYHGGPLRVLTIAHLMRHRETVELAQRLSMTYETMITAGTQFADDYFFLTKEETIARNQAALDAAAHDVIVIGRVAWKQLPRSLREGIALRVYQGAGLVINHHEGLTPFMREASVLVPESVPKAEDEFELEADAGPEPEAVDAAKDYVTLSMFTSELGLDALKLASTTFGEGRVVSVFGLKGQTVTSGAPPFSYELAMGGDRHLRILYECHMAHFLKAVVYAARREAKVHVTIMRPPRPLPASDLADQGLDVNLSGVVSAATADVMIVDSLGQEVYRRTLPVASGQAKVHVDIPVLPAGRPHYLLVRLYNPDQHVVNWDAAALNVTAANGVAAIHFSPDNGAQHKAIGQVQLRQALSSTEQAMVRIVDNLGRELWRKSYSQGAELSFAANLPKPLVSLHHLEVKLLQNGKVQATADRSFPMALPPVDNYRYIVWTEPFSFYYRQLLYDRYHELGVDAVLSGLASGGHTLAASNLRGLPYIYKLSPKVESKEEKRQRLRAEARQAATNAIEDDVDLALEDEDAPQATPRARPSRNPCFNDPEWRQTTKTILSEQAQAFAPWSPLAFSLGDENRLNALCESSHCRAAFRKWLKSRYGSLDALNKAWKSAHTTWSAIETVQLAEAKAANNITPWLDRQCFNDDVFNQAHRYCRDVVREQAPQAGVGYTSFLSRGANSGYNIESLFSWADFNTQYQDRYYDDLMRALAPRDGLFGLNQGTYAGRKHKLEFVVYPWAEFFRGATGKLWWRGMGFRDAVSCLDAGYEPLPSWGNTVAMANEVRQGIYDLRRQYRWDNLGIYILYNDEDVYHAVAELGDEGVRAWEQSWWGVADALRELGLSFDFVTPKQIAARGVPVNAKLLVLCRNRTLPQAVGDAILEFGKAGGVVLSDEKPSDRLLSQLGNAVTVFGPLPEEGQHARLRAVIGKATVTAGARPPVTLSIDGAEPEGWHRYYFVDGDIRLLGITADDARFDEPPVTATLNWSGKRHLYDVRQGKYLGQHEQLDVTLAPDDVRLFATLPHKVEAVRLTLEQDIAHPGKTFKLNIASPSNLAGATSCYVTVTGPSGPLRHHAQSLRLPAQSTATYEWRPALNDPPGAYTLTVRETISGNTVDAQVQLGPAQANAR